MNKSLSLYLCTALLTGISALPLSSCKSNNAKDKAEEYDLTEQLTSVRFSGDSAMNSVRIQCDFGPRIPESAAHKQCGEYIATAFQNYGLEVKLQDFTAKSWDGKTLSGRNIQASYRPDLAERVVLAAHWDSRPWADEDPDSTKHRLPVLAANDGASGVAVLIEVARNLKELNPAVGVDLVCFDIEDYGAPYWGQGDESEKGWCLGSQHWAEQARDNGYRARYGILLDMVGGKDACFRFEGFSMRYAETIMKRLWATAQTVGAGSLFLKQEGGYATDDHVPMNETANIPTVDVIPYVNGAKSSFGQTWHTTNDTPEYISKENLRLVGQTLLQMLSEEM